MEIDWFDLDQPTSLDLFYNLFGGKEPIVYPLKLSKMNEFLQWNCIWCDKSYFYWFEHTLGLPMLNLGKCKYNKKEPLELRSKRLICKHFEPMDEYNNLIKAKLLILEFRISHNDFLFL